MVTESERCCTSCTPLGNNFMFVSCPYIVIKEDKGERLLGFFNNNASLCKNESPVGDGWLQAHADTVIDRVG